MSHPRKSAEDDEPVEPYRMARDLLPEVYVALREVAAQRLKGEARNTTLQPTALVHEAWLRLQGEEGTSVWRDEGHFFRTAAEAMRRILVDRARQRQTVKHGGAFRFVELDEKEADLEQLPFRLLEVDEILDLFAEVDVEASEVVKLRYFVGMTVDETASALGVSERTVRRRWAYAKAWLAHELS